MRILSQIDDPIFQGSASYSGLDRFFLRFIRDERDLPFIYLCLKITFTLIPSAIVLYSNVLEGWIWWAWAGLHLLLCVGYFLGPFTLMLHNTSHNPFFREEYGIGNKYIPWVIGPFMGQSPDLYFIHHMGMHHAEGNMPLDRSSTMPYQRDSFINFLEYYTRFMFIGIFELVDYLRSKKRFKMIPRAYFGELLFWTTCGLLAYFVNVGATMAVFILPIIMVRFGMMAGNWAQHAFVDADEPNNDYKSSITCINSRYNKICFNDGYHIGHHLIPSTHWTDMPTDFLQHKDEYARQQAFVFEGLDYFIIWALLMLKRYKFLASRLVNINGNTFASEEEAIAIMKQRLAKFTPEALAKFTPALPAA